MSLQEGFALPKKDCTIASRQPGGKYAVIEALNTAGTTQTIAMLGINNLTQSSFTTDGSVYSNDIPACAFDGFKTDGTPYNSAATSQLNRSIFQIAEDPGRYLQIDFGTETSMSGWRYVNTSYGGWAPPSIEVQISSDGTSWTSVDTQTGFYNNPVDQQYSFSSTTGRYIRFILTGNGTNWYIIEGIEVYA